MGKKYETILLNMGCSVYISKSTQETLNKLSQNPFDALFIVAPYNDNFSLMNIALDYHFPICVEKPFCYSYTEAKIIVRRAQKKNVPIFGKGPTQCCKFAGAANQLIEETLNDNSLEFKQFTDNLFF